MTDPISDMLTRIRNATLVRKQEVGLPYSKLKQHLAELLQKQGWLKSVEVKEEQNRKILLLNLNYDASGKPAISGLKRVSRPGQRIYAKVAEIPRWHLGIGAIIISTPKGLMTDREARKEKTGGEIICQIW